jgi:hypothetical protein
VLLKSEHTSRLSIRLLSYEHSILTILATMASNPPQETMEKKHLREEELEQRRGTVVDFQEGTALNASGHKDQLKRQYGLLGICGLALNIDNAWIALGGSVTISIGGYAVYLYAKPIPTSNHSKWRTCRCPLRTHSSLLLLCRRRSLYRRARVCNPIRRRCLPLRVYNTWTKVRSRAWVLRWLNKFLRVAVRLRFHHANLLECCCPALRPFPYGPCHPTMARLRRVYPDHVASHPGMRFRE